MTVGAPIERQSHHLVRLDETLLEAWTSGNAAYDTLDDGLRRLAIHLGLLRETIETGDTETAIARVELLEEALAKLRLLVHRLEWLDELREQEHAPGRLAVDTLLDRVLRRHAAGIEESGALVVLEELPTVWAAADDLDIVFSELIANALRYRSDGPLAIRISAEHVQRDWVDITVRDTASGFSDEYRESVFEPGVVLLRDGVRPGAGVGLAACRFLVERNRGHIRVESTPGEGSAFIVTLPTGRPATAA